MFLKRFFLLAVLLLAAGSAHAQSSLGIGGGEQVIQPSGGIFGEFFVWVGTQQREFYRAMTAALKTMREDGSAVWLLVGLSFLYGVLHAVGPGHGKVVISSYMVANETMLRRGVWMSFAASLLQAISAIVIVGLGFALLRGTSVSMTDAATWLEMASYALIIGFGVWLFWRKARPLMHRTAPLGVAHAGHEHHHDHHHDHHHAHQHHDGEVCSTCGHAHMPTPDQLAGPMDWRSALAAVVAVGIRPCSGAIIVLSFALLNGLYFGGVVSVFAMALGTAITVSSLAVMAVTAKNVALKFSNSAVMNAKLHLAIELSAAALLILLGSVLLIGALSV